MHIAVEGCAHGELDKIYAALAEKEKAAGIKVDLLLCCGDFQAVRNEADLATMACPDKYKDMRTFYKYYSGECVAPVLTVFIGGNHEASAHLWELYYGGWVAPNIYYLGHAGSVRFGGLRIAGLSGIFKSHDYPRGYFESIPYDRSGQRSAYHVRKLEVDKLLLLTGLPSGVDIMLSHDWPAGVAPHGNLQELYRYKSFLKNEIEDGSLGSPPARQLMDALQPTRWFSAHLHCRFPATVPHEQTGAETHFLALDKCLPRRKFLELVSLEPRAADDAPPRLEYDPDWLAILVACNDTFSRDRNVLRHEPVARPTAEDVERIRKIVVERNGSLEIPQNFVAVASAYNPNARMQRPFKYLNETPQTDAFTEMLGILNPVPGTPQGSEQPRGGGRDGGRGRGGGRGGGGRDGGHDGGRGRGRGGRGGGQMKRPRDGHAPWPSHTFPAQPPPFVPMQPMQPMQPMPAMPHYAAAPPFAAAPPTAQVADPNEIDLGDSE